ncbi:adenosine deaminase-like protein isoform X2 [Athalia rosae]|uniref:adenosine deaminase-like protein isoform X2 n=1 Tax=Athalia rosae TaxID=37344 RepID=UPI002033E4DE|nr:adenosine deaminase-like protein isoform X2 [Athalia rosae]
MDLTAFCQSLPKLELHAHLNGSLSPGTLLKLNALHNLNGNDGDADRSERQLQPMELGDQNSLEACFKMFSIAHELTSAPEYVRIATEHVIREFHDDNVIYLELRSTPRAIQGGMSKKEYIEAIIDAIRASEVSYPKIMVKFLISVDRKRGYKDARENIQLGIELRKKYAKYVVGIDLSGDPTKESAFIELLHICREAGLKIAAHCAEVPNPVEVKDILNFKPDRLGHCTCIHPNLGGSKELLEMLLASNIPVELCPTSNVKCGTVPNYESHHFQYLYKAGHPISLSTDDKGVFATSLSKEYEYIAEHFSIGLSDLRKIARSAINYTFASDVEKEKLAALFDSTEYF